MSRGKERRNRAQKSSFGRHGLRPTIDSGKPEAISADVNVAFYGINHEALNRQSALDLEEVMVQTFGSVKGRRVVLLENASYTGREAEAAVRSIDSIGFVKDHIKNLMTGELKRGVTNREVRERVSEIIRARSFSQVLIKKLLPINDLHLFTYHQVLDRVRGKYPFDVVYEQHDQNFIRQDSEVATQYKSDANISEQMWNEGRFDEALQVHKRSYETVVRLNGKRDPDIVDLAGLQVEKLYGSPGENLLFIIFGASHEANVLDGIRSRFMGRSGFKAVSSGGMVGVRSLLDMGIRNGEEVDDLLYARHLLAHMMTQATISAHLEGYGNFDSFIENYNTCLGEIAAYVENLSFEDIRAVCEGEQKMQVLLVN